MSNLQSLVAEWRLTARSLRRAPLYTLTVILVLALGIGATTTVASLVHGILLDPLPYADSDRLVVLEQSDRAGENERPFSIKEFFELREQSTAFASLAEYHAMTFTLLGQEEPLRVSTGVVSSSFFDLLGITPVHGRGFLASDENEGAEAVLILSHGFWQQNFGGDESVVGRSFEMNDKPHTVVGVLPAIPQCPAEHDVYMPTVACPFRAAAQRRMEENRNAFRGLTVFGRLGDGSSLEAAQSDVAVLADRFAGAHPDVYPADQGLAFAARQLRSELVQGARGALAVLAATSILVLLIACANVANLSLARMMRRSHELALRSALGAGRGLIVRHGLLEGATLALAGSAVGAAIAFGSLGFFRDFLARFTARAPLVDAGPWVLAFALLLALITAGITTLLSWLSLRRGVADAMRQGGRGGTGGRQHLRGALIALQVAVSAVLLVGAGLLLRSLGELQRVDLGFDPEGVLTAEVSLNWSRYTEAADRIDFFERTLAELRARPGIVSAAAGIYSPLSDQGPSNQAFVIEGRPLEDGQRAPQLDLRTASTGYFETLEIPLLSGRDFSSRDDAEAPAVAIVNQSLAERYWSDRDPLNRRISLDGGESWISIVGVVGDVRQYGLDSAAADELYVPLAQAGFASRLLVRTASSPLAHAETLKAAVHGVDPQQPISNIEALEERRREHLAAPRLTATLLGGFAAIALALAAAGIGGLMAYSVSERRREIGVRMALGADRGSVLAMIVRGGVLITAVGLLVGALGAAAFTRLIEASLFQVPRSDPRVWVVVAGGLLLTGALAAALPAWRAARILPTEALREE
ncbi:MAG: hypothetical protein DWQ36_10125 [Acidobacteria bacterium]|nr:MAG: hypothetical protein DWQ36_10125 [Acidobacteriota bacterium]